MKLHTKKMIAPIVVTLLIIAYYVVYFCVLLTLVDGVIKYVLGLLPVILSILMVVVCIERIKEIRKGEEDDLSQY